MNHEKTELTVAGIIEFAVHIEEESARYYETAITKYLKNNDEELIELLEDLSLEEIKHKKRLMDRFQVIPDSSRSIASPELQNTVDMLVSIPEPADDASVEDILHIALLRENSTRDLYVRLLSLSELGYLADVFEELVDQETGHARRIQSMLEKRTNQ